MSPAKVLVIRLSSIGDIVLTTPVLRQLRQELVEGSEIHYFTKPAFAEIVKHNPNVDRVVELEEDLVAQCEALKQEGYDYIIDLHKNLRSARIKSRIPVLSFTVDKLTFHKWKLILFKNFKTPASHIVLRYLETVKALGCQEDDKGLEFYIPDSVSLPQLAAERFVAYVLGATHEGKKLTFEHHQRLLNSIDQPVVLLGGKAEKDLGLRLENETGAQNMAGKCSLFESSRIVEHAAVVVTGDTGLMHIASAFGKKIISFWGCTSPSLGMYPYKPHPDSVMIEPKGREKRPCSKLGDHCKYGMDQRCTSVLDDDEIIQNINRLF